MNTQFFRRYLQVTRVFRLLLSRRNNTTNTRHSGQRRNPRSWYPDQYDMPLYEPANIRGFFWGEEEED